MFDIKAVDLRSDTLTLPSGEMREAMASALVGDDVYGEDPTVIRLQEEAAALVGKEDAIFVPSGTMGNQLAILAHTERGDEVLADSQAHIYYYEVGAPAMWAGVSIRPLDGLLAGGGLDVLRNALRPADIHFPATRLVCLENTFNRGSGTVMFPDEMKDIYHFAGSKGLKVHLDGARLFNAAVFLGKDVREFTANCDSVMFCLSKGLGAPVGSMLAGDSGFIARARKYRKALGGGMRQAGVLAAAGLVALKNINRLEEDHRHARVLAKGLSALPVFEIELDRVQTNIVVARVAGGIPASGLVRMLGEKGVKCSAFGPDLVRFVTHLNVGPEDVEYTLKAAGELSVNTPG
nr:GntG family PLP-dependent aldolase [Desulfocucumis palustris]